MKTKKMLLALISSATCLCFANGSLHAEEKTLAEELGDAIDSVTAKAKGTTEAIKDAAKDTQEAVANKSDDFRDKIAEAIKPS